MREKPIILYDGVCGLCNRLNQFLLRRDHADRLRFASLQSNFAHELLSRHRLNPEDLNTVYLVLNYGTPNERLLVRSDAILHAVTELGGIWRLAGLSRLLPEFIRDAVYRLVASNRYRIFGKLDSCILPEPEYRSKFVDGSA